MLDNLLTPFHSWLVELRRELHQWPELAYQEERTSARIAQILTELGVPFRKGVGGTGVVATLQSERPGPWRAMRADMDALPLEEANDVPYRSKRPGLMHACGHDGHMTIALGVLRTLVERGWRESGRGGILFVFQPAEEGGAGARVMLQSPDLASQPLRAVFAGHLFPDRPAGDVELAPEASNAASDEFHIRLVGKGGHGAHPELCTDPIVAGAYFVTQLQSLVSRTVSPLESVVLTIGRFEAGTASNIIPHEASLWGTLRTLKPKMREEVLERLGKMIRGVEEAHRVKAQWAMEQGYPLLVNDSELAGWAWTKARELLGAGQAHWGLPSMGAEDFAYFAQKWPAVLIRLGCHDPAQGFVHGLHSPYFDFDERVLDVGVRLFVRLLTEFEKTDEEEGEERSDRVSVEDREPDSSPVE